jgi:hypothetical protein
MVTSELGETPQPSLSELPCSRPQLTAAELPSGLPAALEGALQADTGAEYFRRGRYPSRRAATGRSLAHCAEEHEVNEPASEVFHDAVGSAEELHNATAEPEVQRHLGPPPYSPPAPLPPHQRPAADELMAGVSPVFKELLCQENLNGGSPEPPREGGLEQLDALVAGVLATGANDPSHPSYLPGACEGAGLTGFSEIHLEPRASSPASRRREADVQRAAAARCGPEVNATAKSAEGIRSIPKAMASPNWKGTGSLEQAAETEFRRIFDTFETLEYVPTRKSTRRSPNTELTAS